MWQSTSNGLAVPTATSLRPGSSRSLSFAWTERQYLLLFALSQAAVVIFAAGLAKLIYIDGVLGQTQAIGPYLVRGVLLALILHYVNKQMRLHTLSSLTAPTIGFNRTWGALALAFMVLLGTLYLLRQAEGVSRGWFMCWLMLSAVGLVGVRWAFRRVLNRLAKSGQFVRRYAVVGTADQIKLLQSELSRTAPQVTVVGLYMSDTRASDHVVLDNDTISELGAAMKANVFERVIIALPAIDRDRIGALYRQIAPYSSEILLYSAAHEMPLPTHGIDTIGNLRADVVSPVPAAEVSRLEKRIFDCVVATVALLALSPILLTAAAAIKLTSPGPVFFRQRRYGRNNQVFRIFKFRTMSVMEDGAKVVQAQRDDPRVTRVGRILRATSIDELPQLLNVLLGHMSIVGPRPHAMAHEEQFETMFDQFSRRRRVLPGITGWAQVNGLRGETRTAEDVKRRMDYDLYYIDHWSIWFDIEIMARTVMTVLRGAY